jgi:AcrR family transcriptional regulator
MTDDRAAPAPVGQGRAGRPRDADVDRRILAAAYEEIVDAGPERLSLRSVARRAGVSRAAVVRRWTVPVALTLAALAAALPSPEVGGVGDFDAELLDAATVLARSMRAPGLELQMRIVADGLTTPAPLHLFQQRLLEPGREQIRAVFVRAQRRGDIPDDLDAGWLADAFIGALLMRTTTHRKLQPPRRSDVDALVRTFLRLR